MSQRPDAVAASRPGPSAPADPAAPLLDRLDHLERQLQAVQAELTASHRLATLGTIASVIAHEFNNILTPIISYAQMAQARPDDVELQQKAIERALDGAQRAARISASMLGFAAGQESDADQDQQGGTDVARCVDDALACLAREPKRDGIALVLDLQPGLRARIAPGALMQVLVNLLLNARKAIGRKGGRLTVTARLVAAAESEAVITVQDTGPGIPEAIRHRLFEPFVTSPITDTCGDCPPRHGTGLGLHICRQLVEAAGGSIAAEPPAAAEQSGTTFTIRLPAG